MPGPSFELRPRSIGELLDLVFRVWRRGFGRFAAIGVAVALINLLLSVGGTFLLFGAIGTVAPAGEALASFAAFGWMLAVVVTSILIYSAGALVITIVVDSMFHGEPLSASAAFRASLGRQPAAMATGILVLFASGAGAMCCFFPGIVIAILFSLALPLVALERLGPINALGRSYDLIWNRGPRGFVTEANWFRVLCVGLVTIVVFYVLQFFTSLPVIVVTVVYALRGAPVEATPLGPHAAPLEVLLPLQLLSALGQGLFVALPILPWTILYYDIRTRHEGLDLELAARGLPPADS